MEDLLCNGELDRGQRLGRIARNRRNLVRSRVSGRPRKNIDFYARRELFGEISTAAYFAIIRFCVTRKIGQQKGSDNERP